VVSLVTKQLGLIDDDIVSLYHWQLSTNTNGN